MPSYHVPRVKRDRGELKCRHICGSFVATLLGAMRTRLVSTIRKLHPLFDSLHLLAILFERSGEIKVQSTREGGLK